MCVEGMRFSILFSKLLFVCKIDISVSLWFVKIGVFIFCIGVLILCILIGKGCVIL